MNKGHLTWLSRPLMEKQKDDYEYFMYLEHDIKFSENNLKYFLKYEDDLNKKKFHLGFLIYEKNHDDKKNYSIHIGKKLKKFIKITFLLIVCLEYLVVGFGTPQLGQVAASVETFFLHSLQGFKAI